MRLDKFLVSMEIGSRSQVKEYIKKGYVCVNGAVCKSADEKVDENNDSITYMGEMLKYQKYQYYILNKPQGVITATQDLHDKTVMDLLNGIRKKDLAPVGRLDKDTEGLLLITNDGELAHAMLSPKKHVDKVYRVRCRDKVIQEAIDKLRNGLDIGDDKPTLPAEVDIVNENELLLTIREGRYHQVKRMLKAIGNEVVYLKREAFGTLTLSDDLKLGDFRELTEAEVKELRKDF